MAQRMHPVNVTHSEAGSAGRHFDVRSQAHAGAPAAVADHAVFGIPFINSAVLLVRTQPWSGRTRVLEAMGLSVGTAWVDVAALGLL